MATRATILALFPILTLLAVGSAQAGSLRAESPDMANGGRVALAQVYGRDGCEGQNRSPAVRWSGVPAGTESFAVTLFDPDAPHAGGWWHWVVFNIPSYATALPAGAGSGGGLPAGAVQALNDFGATGYGGPCPPSDVSPHHYELTVWALDVARLPADSGTAALQVAHMIQRHAIGQARIVARYGR